MTESESGVLPLHYTSILHLFCGALFEHARIITQSIYYCKHYFMVFLKLFGLTIFKLADV